MQEHLLHIENTNTQPPTEMLEGRIKIEVKRQKLNLGLA